MRNTACCHNEFKVFGRQNMKVLIISHNPISNQSNMGKTFLSLFSQFDKEELCQLYIYPVIPNEDRCASYYRVTDKDALNSLIRLKKPGGEVPAEQISENQGLYEETGDQAFYKNRRNKSALRRLLRDAMWKVAPWYNSSLKAWLDREKPECIFVAPGVAKFLYDFALRISKKLHIPIVTYICDEYYFVKTPKLGLDALRLKLLQRKMESLMEATSHLVTISAELKAEYAEKFGVETTVLMTGATVSPAKAPKTVSRPENICYFGNIRCNRFVPLAQIGRALDQIYQAQGKRYRLKIYTAERDTQILNTFADTQSVELCGFVSGAEFDKALQEADLLLHTEAFDEASIDFTRHSISTKIADSLASGIPLFAFGPDGISSMLHLQRNRCAITVTDPRKLRDALERALSDEKTREQAAQMGLAVAAQYHDSEMTGLLLRDILAHMIEVGKR